MKVQDKSLYESIGESVYEIYWTKVCMKVQDKSVYESIGQKCMKVQDKSVYESIGVLINVAMVTKPARHKIKCWG